MIISELIEKLETAKTEKGDIEVMFNDPEGHGPYSATSADVDVAEKDAYPADWDMPEGFTFVNIGNW